MTDEYKTIQSAVRAETKVEGSRFIASASPVTTKNEANAFIERIRKSFFDATHNCFAYRIGMGENLFRCNDDGEPSGSAGKPILAAIDKPGLSDVVTVVTRYFGGTKLGVGGLARAYGNAAAMALSSAEIVARYKLDVVEVSFPHSHISDVMHVVSKTGARIVETIYDEEVHVHLEIRQSRLEEMKLLLVNQTSGKVRLK